MMAGGHPAAGYPRADAAMMDAAGLPPPTTAQEVLEEKARV